MSRFSHLICKTSSFGYFRYLFGLPHLSQEVLSQLQLTYLYYLELSLTLLQNYNLLESLIKSYEALKSKKTITAIKIDK